MSEDSFHSNYPSNRRLDPFTEEVTHAASANTKLRSIVPPLSTIQAGSASVTLQASVDVSMPCVTPPNKRPSLQGHLFASPRRVSHDVPAPMYLSSEDFFDVGRSEASAQDDQAWSPNGVECTSIGIKPELLLIFPTSPEEASKNNLLAASAFSFSSNGASLLWSTSKKRKLRCESVETCALSSFCEEDWP